MYVQIYECTEEVCCRCAVSVHMHVSRRPTTATAAGGSFPPSNPTKINSPRGGVSKRQGCVHTYAHSPCLEYAVGTCGLQRCSVRGQMERQVPVTHSHQLERGSFPDARMCDGVIDRSRRSPEGGQPPSAAPDQARTKGKFSSMRELVIKAGNRRFRKRTRKKNKKRVAVSDGRRICVRV